MGSVPTAPTIPYLWAHSSGEERLLDTQEAVGSNPTVPTTPFYRDISANEAFAIEDEEAAP